MTDNDINLQPLIEVMAALRHEETGCPWDKSQTHESLVHYTIEEIEELIAAIAYQDSENLCEELGDLLFHLVFYARISEEAGNFAMQDVIDGTVSKMRRRHPHVFAGKIYTTQAEQQADWARIKSLEKQSQFPAYPNLDASAKAQKNKLHQRSAIWQSVAIQNHLARLGFDWPDAQSVLNKIDEELTELTEELQQPNNNEAIAEEYGDLLFSVLNIGRKLGLDSELVLRQANHKFSSRSDAMIDLAGDVSLFSQLDLAEKEALWQQVKSNKANLKQ